MVCGIAIDRVPGPAPLQVLRVVALTMPGSQSVLHELDGPRIAPFRHAAKMFGKVARIGAVSIFAVKSWVAHLIMCHRFIE